jgi:hypothetical protein
VELLGRAIQHLPVSTFELFTLAMVLMGLMIYAFWWSRPLDVRLPIVLERNSADARAQETLDRVYSDLMKIEQSRQSLSVGQINQLGWFKFIIPTLAASIFGACHLIGWNFEFPTRTEHLLWRIGSVCCLALPLIIIAHVTSAKFDFDDFDWRASSLIVIYFIVRVYLIVEVFIGLRKVPADVYETVQWSQYFPHF